jgi:hypothetical protein
MNSQQIYFIMELVASFANRANLLKYEEKTHICASSSPIERTSKTCGDYAHSVLRSSTACHAFFWLHQSHMPVLACTMTKARSVCTTENSQPVLRNSATTNEEFVWRNAATQFWVERSQWHGEEFQRAFLRRRLGSAPPGAPQRHLPADPSRPGYMHAHPLARGV